VEGCGSDQCNAGRSVLSMLEKEVYRETEKQKISAEERGRRISLYLLSLGRMPLGDRDLSSLMRGRAIDQGRPYLMNLKLKVECRDSLSSDTMIFGKSSDERDDTPSIQAYQRSAHRCV